MACEGFLSPSLCCIISFGYLSLQMFGFLLPGPSGAVRMNINHQGVGTWESGVPPATLATSTNSTLLGTTLCVSSLSGHLQGHDIGYLIQKFETSCWYLAFSAFLSPSTPWIPLTLFCTPIGWNQILNFANNPQGPANPFIGSIDRVCLRVYFLRTLKPAFLLRWQYLLAFQCPKQNISKLCFGRETSLSFLPLIY